MDRIINVVVNGSHLTKDSRMGGVQHESNSRYLRVAFDPGWDKYAKKITFWNALGQNPVELTFTTDKLEDAAKSYRLYLCPIPGEALSEAGEFTFVIDGWVDGVRQRSVEGKLLCEPASYIDKADQPSDPTPTQAEQLQKQIDDLKPQIQGAAQAANAVAEAEAAAAGARQAEINAGTHSLNGQAAAQSAQSWAEVARAEAERASVPAVEGVYNIVLTDRVSGEKWALVAENGVLTLLGVSYQTATHEPVLIDRTTNTAWQLVSEGGVLKLMEV